MLRSSAAFLGRSSIRTRIAAGFGILLALLVTVAFSSDRNLRNVRLNVAEGSAAAASSDALSSFAGTFLDAWHLADVYLYKPGASQLVAARAAQVKADGALGRANTDVGGLRPDIDRFKQAFETLAATIAGRQKALAILAASGARLGNIGFTMASAATATAAAGETGPAGPAAQRLNQSIQALLTAAYRFALLGGGGEADIMGVEAERIRADLPILRSSPAPSRPTVLLDSESAAIDRLLDAAEALRGSVSRTEAQVNELTKIGAAISDRIDVLRTTYLARRDASAAEASATIEHVLLIGMVAAAVAVGLGILIAVLIGASISRLIARITEVMSALAAGDLAVTISNAERRDEIGRMARALGVFKDGAIEKLRLGSEAAEARRLGEDERNRRESEKAEEARQDRMALDALAEGLRRLATGDLVSRIDSPLGAKVEPLRLDFNASVRTLQAAMLAIMADASDIGGATGEMSGSADDLSRRTEQQAASLAETAAALDEINATVRQTAQSASHAREVVATAKSDAERSGQVLSQTVEAMSGIERSAGQIGTIIGVIDEIAFQTNLLALNAGVEAARAGEAGRGFAVVASEVRALAQRSAEAAREIKALISASSHHVAQGVDLVGQTGTAVARILANVAEINGIVADIAASAHEQSQGLDQVNTAINQMDQFTQQNAAMVDASTQACHALSEKTESLSRRIGGFRLDAAGSTSRSRAERRSPAGATRTPSGTTRSRGTALHLAPVANAETWHEF